MALLLNLLCVQINSAKALFVYLHLVLVLVLLNDQGWK